MIPPDTDNQIVAFGVDRKVVDDVDLVGSTTASLPGIPGELASPVSVPRDYPQEPLPVVCTAPPTNPPELNQDLSIDSLPLGDGSEHSHTAVVPRPVFASTRTGTTTSFAEANSHPSSDERKKVLRIPTFHTDDNDAPPPSRETSIKPRGERSSALLQMARKSLSGIQGQQWGTSPPAEESQKRRTFMGTDADPGVDIAARMQLQGRSASNVGDGSEHKVPARRGVSATANYIRFRLWIFLEEPWDTPASIVVHFVMVCIICWSIFHRIHTLSTDNFNVEEETCVCTNRGSELNLFFNIIFALDTATRFGSYPLPSRFLTDPKNIVDVMSLMPFILISLLEGSGEPSLDDVLKWFCTFEAFLRLLRLSRFFSGWQLLFHAIITSFKALVIPMLFLVLIVMFGACSLYMFEVTDAHGEIGSSGLSTVERNQQGLTTILNLHSAIHFSLICILSIGTGPYYSLQATSLGGKVTVLAMMVFGMLFMAMPIAIVGACFSQTWFDQDRIVLLYKVRCRLQAQGFGPQDIYDVFDEVDEDGSGEVEFLEFKKMIETFNLPSMNAGKMRRLFAYFDHDCDGVISFIDFANTLYPDSHWEDRVISSIRSSKGPDETNLDGEKIHKTASQASADQVDGLGHSKDAVAEDKSRTPSKGSPGGVEVLHTEVESLQGLKTIVHRPSPPEDQFSDDGIQLADGEEFSSKLLHVASTHGPGLCSANGSGIYSSGLNSPDVGRHGRGSTQDPLGLQRCISELDRKINSRFDQLITVLVKKSVLHDFGVCSAKPFNPVASQENYFDKKLLNQLNQLKDIAPSSAQQSRRGSMSDGYKCPHTGARLSSRPGRNSSNGSPDVQRHDRSNKDKESRTSDHGRTSDRGPDIAAILSETQTMAHGVGSNRNEHRRVGSREPGYANARPH